MKRGFSGNATILAMVLLTTQNGAVASEALHLGGCGGMPPGKFCISDLLRSFLVQSGSNSDRYFLEIYLIMGG